MFNHLKLEYSMFVLRFSFLPSHENLISLSHLSWVLIYERMKKYLEHNYSLWWYESSFMVEP